MNTLTSWNGPLGDYYMTLDLIDYYDDIDDTGVRVCHFDLAFDHWHWQST